MHIYIVGMIMFMIICTILMFISYPLGTKKALQYLFSFLLPAFLGGTAIHIGHFVLPNFTNITYYIAGITTIIFYLIFSPIFLKKDTDRYHKISKLSKIFGCVIILLNSWFILSFSIFFIDMVYSEKLGFLDNIIDIIVLPIRCIWFFPKN